MRGSGAPHSRHGRPRGAARDRPAGGVRGEPRASARPRGGGRHAGRVAPRRPRAGGAGRRRARPGTSARRPRLAGGALAGAGVRGARGGTRARRGHPAPACRRRARERARGGGDRVVGDDWPPGRRGVSHRPRVDRPPARDGGCRGAEGNAPRHPRAARVAPAPHRHAERHGARCSRGAARTAQGAGIGRARLGDRAAGRGLRPRRGVRRACRRGAAGPARGKGAQGDPRAPGVVRCAPAARRGAARVPEGRAARRDRLLRRAHVPPGRPQLRHPGGQPRGERVRRPRPLHARRGGAIPAAPGNAGHLDTRAPHRRRADLREPGGLSAPGSRLHGVRGGRAGDGRGGPGARGGRDVARRAGGRVIPRRCPSRRRRRARRGRWPRPRAPRSRHGRPGRSPRP